MSIIFILTLILPHLLLKMINFYEFNKQLILFIELLFPKIDIFRASQNLAFSCTFASVRQAYDAKMRIFLW